MKHLQFGIWTEHDLTTDEGSRAAMAEAYTAQADRRREGLASLEAERDKVRRQNRVDCGPGVTARRAARMVRLENLEDAIAWGRDCLAKETTQAARYREPVRVPCKLHNNSHPYRRCYCGHLFCSRHWMRCPRCHRNR
jgi:hypothetical protein